MAGKDVIGWLPLFEQTRAPELFLSRFFTLKQGGVYQGSKVSLDIQRFGEDVAVPVKTLGGETLYDMDDYTNKEFTPPIFDPAMPFNANDTINRFAGSDPYTSAYEDAGAKLLSKINSDMGRLFQLLLRTLELQASQILTTGQLNLTGGAGYTIDFKPKSAHFPTAGTAWNAGGATPINDLKSLAEVISDNGQTTPVDLIMGETSFCEFVQISEVQNLFNKEVLNLGALRPEMVNSGAVLQGTINIGSFRFFIWTYRKTYKDPISGLQTKFVPDDKVIMLGDGIRLDRSFGRVELPFGVDSRFEQFMPDRLTSVEGGFDFTPNVYASENNTQLKVALYTRPLLIPVQIDGFGCLDTGV